MDKVLKRIVQKNSFNSEDIMVCAKMESAVTANVYTIITFQNDMCYHVLSISFYREWCNPVVQTIYSENFRIEPFRIAYRKKHPVQTYYFLRDYGLSLENFYFRQLWRLIRTNTFLMRDHTIHKEHCNPNDYFLYVIASSLITCANCGAWVDIEWFPYRNRTTKSVLKLWQIDLSIFNYSSYIQWIPEEVLHVILFEF